MRLSAWTHQFKLIEKKNTMRYGGSTIADSIQKRTEKQHDTMIIGIFLSIVGGFLDAYSYLLKGKVFANAQTGNLIFLCLSLAKHEFHKLHKYIIPIFAFAVGILVSEVLKNQKFIRNYDRMIAVLVFEALVIAGIGFLDASFSYDMINSIISFIAAIQVANFDKVDGNPIATTMITGNLRSSMINLAKYHALKDKKYLVSMRKYFIIIGSFGIGVIIGLHAIEFYAEKSLWLCEVFLLLAFIMIQKEEHE